MLEPSFALSFSAFHKCCQMMKEQAGGTCGSESIDAVETYLAMWNLRMECYRPLMTDHLA